MHTQIIQVGNSLGLRLPKALLDSLSLGKSSTVDLREEGGVIVLRPIPAPRKGWNEAFAAQPATAENLWGDLPVDEGWDA